MIMPNTLSASSKSHLEEDMLRSVDQRMEDSRRENAGRFLKHLAVGESCDGRHDRIAPVRQRPGAVIQMGASENDRSQRHGPELILDQGAEQDLLGERSRRQDQQ